MSVCKKNNDLQIDYPAQGQYGETDLKISLRLSTKTRIVVYENGDTIPTWSKDITVQ